MQIKSMIQAGAMVLTLLSLTACGFGLRGISETGIQLVPTYSHVNIITENNAVSYALKHKLETQMAQLGVVSDTNAAIRSKSVIYAIVNINCSVCYPKFAWC